MALIAKSLQGVDVGQELARHRLTWEDFNARRLAFVAGGCEAVRRAGPDEPWLQANLVLGDGAAMWLRLLCGDLLSWTKEWCAADDARRFFYIYKPPGVRLRFGGGQVTPREGVSQLLARAAAGRPDWTFGTYDPEWHQFGGARGLELAHQFFTLDSMAWLGFQRLRLLDAAVLSPDEFSLTLLHPLLDGLVGDRWELWDLWCNVVLTGRLTTAVGSSHWWGMRPTQAESARAVRLLDDGEGRRGRPSCGEVELLATFRAGCESLVAAVLAAERTGQLLWGLREIVPFWMVCHWNRGGLTFDEQSHLTVLMTHLLCPKSAGPGEGRPR